jgi:HAE1 family hydrophobic/amphiphilic exporter-1
MVFLICTLIGIVSLFRLPVELQPNVQFGNISLEINVRGGIPPVELEEKVIKPIEDNLATIDGLKNILTISEESHCEVVLYFNPEVNLDYAVVEVRERYAQLQDKLPKEVERPVIAKYEYQDVPIVILAVTSASRSAEELRKITEGRIKNRVSRVEGVARVMVGGGREEKIFAELDEMKLRSFNLSTTDIIRALYQSNLNLLSGSVEGARNVYLVRTMGELKSLEDIANTPIFTSEEGKVLHLKDIAKVHLSYMEAKGYARVNAIEAVSLYVQKESYANTIKTVDLLQKELQHIRDELPKDISIRTTFNHAEYIKGAIVDLRSDLLVGAAFTVMILWPFIPFLFSSVIMMTIPLSVAMIFLLMWVSHLSLNVITISGISLGIGLLVDSSIVVMENIFRKRQEMDKDSFNKEELQKTAIEGASEVLLAITTSCLTTIIVFLPLIFLNKEIQKLYSGLALTVIYSLVASLFYAFTFVPLLLSYLNQRRTQGLPGAETLNPVKRIIQKIKSFDFTIITKAYISSLRFVLNFRFLAIVISMSLFIGSLLLYPKLGQEFLGMAREDMFTVYVQMPSGTKLEITDHTVRRLEKLLKDIPEIQSYTSHVEPWSSKVYVELKPYSKRKRSVDEVIEYIRQKTEHGFEPAFIYSQQPESVGRKEIIIEVLGPDFEQLTAMANEIGGRIQGLGKFKDIKLRMRGPRPEVHLILDKKRIAMHGLSVNDVVNILHAKLRGLIPTRYHTATGEVVLRSDIKEGSDLPEIPLLHSEPKNPTAASEDMLVGGREIEIITRLDEEFRKTIKDVLNISFKTPQGYQIFLPQIAEVTQGLGPTEIWRKNKERMVQVSADTQDLSLSESVALVNMALKDMQFPKFYHYKFGETYEKMVNSRREMTMALALSLFLVFLVLASMFESFAQPFIILFSVPLAAIGVFPTLYFTHQPICVGVYIGAIVLIGITVNSAILFIDFANQIRGVGVYRHQKKGSVDLQEAVVKAATWRIRPILMTSLTTIISIFPLIFRESETANLWKPLALTIVSGMITSTLLTLYVIPSMYLTYERFISRKSA